MLSTLALEVLLAKMNKYGSDQPYMGHACITKQCNHFENKENGIVAKQRLHIRSVFARRRADTWDFEGKEVGGGGAGRHNLWLGTFSIHVALTQLLRGLA